MSYKLLLPAIIFCNILVACNKNRTEPDEQTLAKSTESTSNIDSIDITGIFHGIADISYTYNHNSNFIEEPSTESEFTLVWEDTGTVSVTWHDLLGQNAHTVLKEEDTVDEIEYYGNITDGYIRLYYYKDTKKIRVYVFTTSRYPKLYHYSIIGEK